MHIRVKNGTGLVMKRKKGLPALITDKHEITKASRHEEGHGRTFFFKQGIGGASRGESKSNGGKGSC